MPVTNSKVVCCKRCDGWMDKLECGRWFCKCCLLRKEMSLQGTEGMGIFAISCHRCRIRHFINIANTAEIMTFHDVYQLDEPYIEFVFDEED